MKKILFLALLGTKLVGCDENHWNTNGMSITV